MVDWWWFFIMNEWISESDQHGRDVTAWCFCKADLVKSCFYGTYACAVDTCMAAMNCAWFSISSSAPFLWTLLNTELLKKNLQFWWRIWKSNSNISAFTSGQERCRTQRRRSAKTSRKKIVRELISDLFFFFYSLLIKLICCIYHVYLL